MRTLEDQPSYIIIGVAERVEALLVAGIGLAVNGVLAEFDSNLAVILVAPDSAFYADRLSIGDMRCNTSHGKDERLRVSV
ncbi:hypothetical protein D3C79_1037950 [compost metagenome]